MNRRFIVLLVLAVLLRLVLMPIALHPDLWAVVFAGKLFAYDGIVNIYDHLLRLSTTTDALTLNYGANFFTYPPLAYFTFGLFAWILKPLQSADFISSLAINLPHVLTDGRLYWHLIVFKLPYLVFDFGCLYFLRRIFTKTQEKNVATILWLFNPLVLYSSYLVGQFDIIPVFFTIASAYFANRRKGLLSALMMGIGGAYKMYPLFFIPLIAGVSEKKIWRRLLVIVVGFIPYLVSVLPFLSSSAFRQVVLLSNQSQKMLFARIAVSGAESLSLFVVGYIALVGFSFLHHHDLWRYAGAVMLLFFALTHYHPQWFLWLTPWLIYYWVRLPQTKTLVVGSLLCWLTITLFFEPSLSYGLFAPLTKQIVDVNALAFFIDRYYDHFQLLSLTRSVFAGLAAVLVSVSFKPCDVRG